MKYHACIGVLNYVNLHYLFNKTGLNYETQLLPNVKVKLASLQ